MGMKGVIFTFLADMVEDKFGLEAWDSILQETNLHGIYVSAESYDDEQLFRLVEAASAKTGIHANDLIRLFGQYSFGEFQKMHPDFCNPSFSLIQFLLSVDNVIHVEVKKLHPDAILPSFKYNEINDKELSMFYNSPRKLCMLAEGLIEGAAEFYNTEYKLKHDTCMHDGADHCHLHIIMV